MPRRTAAAVGLLLPLLAACASTPLSPAAAQVPVYQAPLDAPAAASRMPEGCGEVARQAPQYRSELGMTGTFRTERAQTAAAGGNVLVALTRQIVPRQCSNCPAASSITDCPPCEGAWFDVVFVSYACPAPVLATLPPERLP